MLSKIPTSISRKSGSKIIFTPQFLFKISAVCFVLIKSEQIIKKNRFIPVKVIDVAGLVPGAHEGKGLGNQFLDDLRRADALIHVVDISGRTNEKGEAADGYDPRSDVKFLENEIDMWFYEILRKNWAKISRKIKFAHEDLIKELTEQLSGLDIDEQHVNEAARAVGLADKTDWDS